MGEQPIFTTKAHVFQIDPKTKKNWIPASSSAVLVSYYFDGSRNSYRIISVEGSKAIINSTITSNMTFTKTSQKFGQWSDPRANTVYGLGFGTEADLAQFVEKFREVKELTRQLEANTNGSTSDEPDPSSPAAVISQMRSLHARTSSMSSVGSENDRRSLTNSLPVSESQVKYENDRLKIALAQSSANAKKWEIELQTLKNNNARLTAALQESTANVEEWKKQLAAYKEESARLKKKVLEIEQGGQGVGGDTKVLEEQVVELSARLQAVEEDKQSKAKEIDSLSSRLQDMTLKESQSIQLADKIKILENENKQLKDQVKDLEIEKDMLEHKMSRETDDMTAVQQQIQNKMSELTTLQGKMSNILKQSADDNILENSVL